MSFPKGFSLYLYSNQIPDMKKPSAQLLRWILIVRKIQNQPYLSFRQLQRELERELAFRGYDPICSDATLKRDLNELKEEFGLDITYSRTHKGYTLPTVRKGWLDMDCIIEPLETMTALGNNTLPDYILPEQYQTKGTQHLSYLIHAIRQQQKIHFLYHKYSDGSISERTLSPYAIKEWRGRWYVLGAENDGKFKTFGLDRMERLTLLPESFIKNEEFDPIQKFKDSFGIYSSDEYPIENVIFTCDTEDGNYLKSRPLHTTQQLLKEEKGEMTFSVRVRISPDFLMEIMSRSWSLRIIQPESLRQQLCDIYRKALQRNENK